MLWHRNLLTAHELGAARYIEFGGGLGKGADPAAKRPNLEGIVKKTFRGAEPAPQYLSVINLASLEQAAAAVQD